MAKADGAVPRVFVNGVKIAVETFSLDTHALCGCINGVDFENPLGIEWSARQTKPMTPTMPITEVRLQLDPSAAAHLQARFARATTCKHPRTEWQSMTAHVGRVLMETVICMDCGWAITRPYQTVDTP